TPQGGIVVTFSARVRVTVYAQDGSRKVVRERSGGHRGFGPTVGQVVEDCIKAAETDPIKRAFVTFGDIFGLYDREQPNEKGHLSSDRSRRPLSPSWPPLMRGSSRRTPRRQTTSQRAIANVQGRFARAVLTNERA